MKKLYILFAFVGILGGCSKFLDIEPKGKVIPKTVEDYRKFINSGYQAFPQYKSLVTFRSDELQPDANSDNFPPYENIFIWQDTENQKETLSYPYQSFYETIFYANQILNNGSQTMEQGAEKQQLIAEAYALRAYSYFGLMNLYAAPYQKGNSQALGVPLNLEIDLEQEFPRATSQRVYEQITQDLQKSIELVQVQQWEAGKNYRFSTLALYAFASRLYLYMGEFEKSADYAQKALAIKSTLVDLNATPEVMPTTFDGQEAILAWEQPFSSQLQNASFASQEMVQIFLQDDLRKDLYLSENSGKYKVKKAGEDAYKCSFRTGEIYLNQAESLARLSQESQAKNVLLSLLKNRYTPAGFAQAQQRIQGLSGDELVKEILAERQRELAFEGHRWFDLRRADPKQIIHTLNGKNYTLQANDPRYTIAFPKDATTNNPNL